MLWNRIPTFRKGTLRSKRAGSDQLTPPEETLFKTENEEERPRSYQHRHAMGFVQGSSSGQTCWGGFPQRPKMNMARSAIRPHQNRLDLRCLCVFVCGRVVVTPFEANMSRDVLKNLELVWREASPTPPNRHDLGCRLRGPRRNNHTRACPRNDGWGIPLTSLEPTWRGASTRLRQNSYGLSGEVLVTKHVKEFPQKL